MQDLRLDGLCFSYGQTELFHDLTASFPSGWTGIVGANGSGKTTLMHLIRGALRPSAGVIDTRGMSVHYSSQEPTQPDESLRRFDAQWDRVAFRLRARLQLGDGELDRFDTLSPGERKRWQIASALHAAPDVLLLDEPTNHLDARSNTLLGEALARYRGIGILVSHDRTLLDRLCHHILRIEGGRAHVGVGNYSCCLDRWHREERGQRERDEQLAQQETKARRALDRARRNQEAAQGRLSTRRRMKGPKDTDARSSAAKARARNGAAKRSLELRGRRRHLEDIEEARRDLGLRRRRGRSIVMPSAPCPVDPLLGLEQGLLRRGSRTLFEHPALQLGRSQRIHLRGANGSGKTTLLERLISSAPARRAQLLYVPQLLPPRPIEGIDTKTAHILAALGVDPSALSRSPAPSPGERRKLAIAEGIARGVWAIIMDEPTNHLDLPAIERLEEALSAFSGALLLVTHDERLAARLCDVTWEIVEATLQIKPV